MPRNLRRRLAVASTALALMLATSVPGSAKADTPAGTFAATPRFDVSGLSLSVFTGGTVDQLEAAATAAAASGVWVQDPTGAYRLLVVAGPAFLKDAFRANFAQGVLGVTSVTLSRSSSAAIGRGSGTVWLCRPDSTNNPCLQNLDTTVVDADGSRTVQRVSSSPDSPFDCFYVYPTVTTQPGDNADLTIEPAEIGIAVVQASRFSQVCRVWAPMYRQQTAPDGRSAPNAVAYSSVLSAWQDYLAQYNGGRPIVFIGHSQGGTMLIQLLRSQVDRDPVLRKQLVSAIILGANVEVLTGRDVGGSFQNIPACRSSQQTGCVIAYSSFLSTPIGTRFGRAGQGVSILAQQTISAGMQVLCTNAANLSGGSGPLHPYFKVNVPAGTQGAVSTPWVGYPNLYSAECKSAAGASWLQVTDLSSSTDRRPRVTEPDAGDHGLHAVDLNMALGDLVQVVSQQEAAYH